jgi:tetratricopeptide (TPR) repeat protein
MKRILLFVLAILLIPVAVHAQGEIDKLMKEGDALYNQREQGKAKDAIKVFEKIVAIDPESYDAYWKIGLAYYWLGRVEDSDSRKQTLYKEGIEFCKLAVELKPEKAEAHFWLGTLYGKFGEAKGVLQSLHLVPHIQKEMNTVIKLDSKYQGGGAYRVLGRLYYKLPSFKGGDINKSEEYLRKAIELGPTNLMNHTFLAETLIKKDKKDEAKKELQKVLDMPPEPGLEPEAKIEKKTAKSIMEEIR